MSPSSSFLPNLQQTLLLKASLLEGPEAISAWNRWNQLEELASIDDRSYRLLPLVYKNMLKHGLDPHHYGRIRGVYKLTWTRNQLLLRDLATAAQALQRNNIEVMLLKGVALALQVYGDYGVRPMSDVDVLVPNMRRQDAIAAVEHCGWRQRDPGSGHNLYSHATRFLSSGGSELHLHWQIPYLDVVGGQEGNYWENAIGFHLGDIPVKTLSPTDQLIHVCLQGYHWDSHPLLTWIADSYHIIESSDIDWACLVERAVHIDAALPMCQALKYLRNEYRLSIPEAVLERLGSSPTTLTDRWQDWIYESKPLPVFGTLVREFVRYQRYAKGRYPFPGFVHHLQVRWSVKGLWQVPLEAFLRAIRRLMIAWMKSRPETVSQSTTHRNKARKK